jgi:hypothetical protein
MKNMSFKIQGGKTGERCTGKLERFAIARFSILAYLPG